MPIPEKIEDVYTYADYMERDEGERVEIINGDLCMMSTPSTLHQQISAALMFQLMSYLNGKKCQAIAAPFAVRLFERHDDKPENVYTVVEPDISVICDADKLDEKGCKGAPDMVIEILSPSSARHDKLTKFNLYQRAGVPEYWIVDPVYKTVQVFLLEDGKYTRSEDYFTEDRIKVHALKDCIIELDKIFRE